MPHATGILTCKSQCHSLMCMVEVFLMQTVCFLIHLLWHFINYKQNILRMRYWFFMDLYESPCADQYDYETYT